MEENKIIMSKEEVEAVLELLKKTKSHIEDLTLVANGIVESFRNNENMEQANKMVYKVADGLELIFEVIISYVDKNEQQIKTDSENIQGIIKNILDAFKNSDFLTLADVFEFEVIPMLEDWGKRF